MKTILIILIVLFLFDFCQAQTDSHISWDGWHVMGSALGTIYLNQIGLSWQKSALIMFMLGFIWEMLDELNSLGYIHHFYLDPRGFDVRDLIRDGVGIAISFPIRKRSS